MTSTRTLDIHGRLAAELKIGTELWEQRGAYPAALHKLAAECNVLSLGEPNWQSDPTSVARAPVAAAAELIRFLTQHGSQGIAIGLGSHVVALHILYASGFSDFDKVARSVLSGSAITCLALTESASGSSLRNIKLTARSSENRSYHLEGEKLFVCNGGRATWLVASAILNGEFALFLVERDDTIYGRDLDCLGWQSLPITHLTFNGTRARLIARGRDAMSILHRGLSLERLNLTVMAATSARCVTDAAVVWAKERQIEGSSLIEKQVISHRIAEMLRQSWLLETAIASLLAQADLPPSWQIAVLKNTGSKTIEHCAREAVQILGAHGCFGGGVVERTFRDSKLISIGGGTEEVLNNVVATFLGR